MFTVSIILGMLTLLGVTTPSLLLIVTFALGAGTTMIRTPIIPTMSALVSRSELPAALTLSAVASNIGRAVGPTVGGFIVTAIAPWAVFFLTSASFVVMIMVLSTEKQFLRSQNYCLCFIAGSYFQEWHLKQVQNMNQI
jgi:MFS family permease